MRRVTYERSAKGSHVDYREVPEHETPPPFRGITRLNFESVAQHRDYSPGMTPAQLFTKFFHFCFASCSATLHALYFDAVQVAMNGTTNPPSRHSILSALITINPRHYLIHYLEAGPGVNFHHLHALGRPDLVLALGRHRGLIRRMTSGELRQTVYIFIARIAQTLVRALETLPAQTPTSHLPPARVC